MAPHLWLWARNDSLRIVVHGMDRSGSASTAAPTMDVVELNILVEVERVVPQKKVSMGYRHGLVTGVRSGTHMNPQLSDTVEKTAGAWDQ